MTPITIVLFIHSLLSGGHIVLGGVVDQTTHSRNIANSNFAAVVAPASANEIEHVGEILVAQMVKSGHGEGHGVMAGVGHPAASQSDLNQGARVVRKDDRVLRQSGQLSRRPQAGEAVTDRACLNVNEGSLGAESAVAQLGGGEILGWLPA